MYRHVELARRRALNEMLLAAEEAESGADLRTRILYYLEQSEYDQRLDAVVASSEGGLDELAPMLDDLVSPNEAAILRGSVARLLESYPDLPGLLLLRGLVEALTRDGSVQTVKENIQAGLGFASHQYRLPVETIVEGCSQILCAVQDKESASEAVMAAILEWDGADRVFVRRLLSDIPVEMAWLPALRLTNMLADASSEMLLGVVQ